MKGGICDSSLKLRHSFPEEKGKIFFFLYFPFLLSHPALVLDNQIAFHPSEESI